MTCRFRFSKERSPASAFQGWGLPSHVHVLLRDSTTSLGCLLQCFTPLLLGKFPLLARKLPWLQQTIAPHSVAPHSPLTFRHRRNGRDRITARVAVVEASPVVPYGYETGHLYVLCFSLKEKTVLFLQEKTRGHEGTGVRTDRGQWEHPL